MREEIYSLLGDAFASFGLPRSLAEHMVTRMRAVAKAFPDESAAQCWGRAIWAEGMSDEAMLDGLRQVLSEEDEECDD